MYKLLLIFLCLIVIFGCATPQVIDTKKELEASANSKLDEWNVSSLVFEPDTTKLEELINSGKVNVKKDRTFFQNNITHVMSNCNVKSLKFVLEKGAPVDDINSFEDTPLSIAVANKHLDCAQVLLDKGARVTGKFNFDNPLMAIAARTNYIPMIKLLIKHNVCPLDNGFINTPLLEIAGLSAETSSLLTSYIHFYTGKFGSKCPEEKPLPKP